MLGKRGTKTPTALLLTALYALSPFILPSLIFIISYQDPFWGDGISTMARAAIEIYDNNNQTFFYLPEHDPGHPTLFPFLLALVWQITGKTLWVAHFFSILPGIGVLLLAKKICAHLQYSTASTCWAMITISLMPVFVAQNAMILTHLPLTFFYLGLFYALLKENKILFVLCGILMFFTHLQAPFLFLSIILVSWAYNVYVQKVKFWKWLTTNFLIFLLPILSFLCWLILHYQHTGWWVVAPNYASHRTPALSLFQFIVNLLTCVWRWLDYGAFLVYIPLVATFFFSKQKIKNVIPIIIIYWWCATVLVLTFGIAYFSGASVAHRYFLPVFIISSLMAAPILSNFSIKYKTLFYFTLLLGNWGYYPGKCIGDATLVYRNYFQIEAELLKEWDTKKIRFYSYAPLANPSKYTHLSSEKGVSVHRLYGVNQDTVPYILQSNCTCDFQTEEIANLNKNWQGASYVSGPLYVNIFTKQQTLPAHRKLRKASNLEKIINYLKQKIKPSAGQTK